MSETPAPSGCERRDDVSAATLCASIGTGTRTSSSYHAHIKAVQVLFSKEQTGAFLRRKMDLDQTKRLRSVCSTHTMFWTCAVVDP